MRIDNSAWTAGATNTSCPWRIVLSAICLPARRLESGRIIHPSDNPVQVIFAFMPEDIAGAVFATGYWVGKEIRWPHTDVGIDSSRFRGGLGAGFTTKARRSPSLVEGSAAQWRAAGSWKQISCQVGLKRRFARAARRRFRPASQRGGPPRNAPADRPPGAGAFQPRENRE